MTEAEIVTTIVASLRKIAPESDPTTLHPDQKIRPALDIDSFDFLRFLIDLNKQLGVEIPETDYGKLSTLQEITHYLSHKNRCSPADSTIRQAKNNL
jgi:acyl carrier protein